jgi:hypothetical protein
MLPASTIDDWNGLELRGNAEKSVSKGALPLLSRTFSRLACLPKQAPLRGLRQQFRRCGSTR